MTRSVGGRGGVGRSACDAAAGGPGIRTGGIAEAAGVWSASGAEGTGAGAGGTPGVLQSQRTHGQSARSPAGGGGSGDSARTVPPQHAAFPAPGVEVGSQHRFRAEDWQHAFGAGAAAAARSPFPSGVAGPWAAAHPQARAGTAAPAAVDTASKRQRAVRALRRVSMWESYTLMIARVNPDHRHANGVPTPPARQLPSGSAEAIGGGGRGKLLAVPLHTRHDSP